LIYAISNITTAGTLTINKAHLTVTANAASKTYGDANPVLSARSAQRRRKKLWKVPKAKTLTWR
jgi:hypothetical protein